MTDSEIRKKNIKNFVDSLEPKFFLQNNFFFFVIRSSLCFSSKPFSWSKCESQTKTKKEKLVRDQESNPSCQFSCETKRREHLGGYAEIVCLLNFAPPPSKKHPCLLEISPPPWTRNLRMASSFTVKESFSFVHLKFRLRDLEATFETPNLHTCSLREGKKKDDLVRVSQPDIKKNKMSVNSKTKNIHSVPTLIQLGF